MSSDGRWCILRTSAASTVSLARSLHQHDFDAWTPTVTVIRRLPRKKSKVERTAAILPTFVFARANHLVELARVRVAPASPHPTFSIFSYFGRVPLIADAQMASLREAEERAAAAYLRQVDRERIAELRQQANNLRVGERVRVSEDQPAFAGLTGIVEGKKGKAAIVNFGAGVTVTIGAWLLESGDVLEHQP